MVSLPLKTYDSLFSDKHCILFESGTTFWAPAWPLTWPGPEDGLRSRGSNGPNVDFGSKTEFRLNPVPDDAMLYVPAVLGREGWEVQEEDYDFIKPVESP